MEASLFERIRSRVWDIAVRWRTYLVNFVFTILVTPELVQALLGFNWGTIIPSKYMGYVTLAVVILNIWMRPRPASRKRDPEVQYRIAMKEHT